MAKSSATSKKKTKSALFSRGRVKKSVIHKATKMTMEQWKAKQVGMDAKWPLPKYMQGQKGHMQFKDETFDIVTRWTEDTKIAYRPHAKRPGSKSHIRYETYSKATTVGQALRLGTYPADWCWDLERGFLKVVGGRVLKGPLNISDMEEIHISPVGKAIYTWYKKELAKKMGVKVNEVKGNSSYAESLDDRATRLLAQKRALEALEAAEREGRMIKDSEVLEVLELWSFYKNPWRTNVMKKGQTWVFSDTLGALRDRQGDIHLTAPTRRYPQVAELFARWLTDRLPKDVKQFKFTSMNVNYNYAAQQHRDAGNFGPSFIHAFGDFSGGELNYWPDDAGAPTPLTSAGLTNANKVQFDLATNTALFNGNCAHSVQPFKGERYSIVWFTLGCHDQLSKADRKKLEHLGIPCPSPKEDPYALLRPPQGDRAAKKIIASGKKAQPSYRSWSKVELEKRPRLSVAAAKKYAKHCSRRRLKPEQEKSFYSTEVRRRKWAKEGRFSTKVTA